MSLLCRASEKSTAVPGEKSRKPQIVPFVHQKWHTGTIFEIDLVNVQDIGLTLSSRIHR